MADRAEIRLPRPTSSWLQLAMLKLSVGQLAQLISLQGEKEKHKSEGEHCLLELVRRL